MFINEKYSTEPLIFINAKNLNYYMMDYLLKNGVDINITNNRECLLTILVKNGCSSSYLKKIIDNENIDINVYDSENNHLVFLLLNNQYYSTLYYILSNKHEYFSLDITDKYNNPLLLKLLEFGFSDMAKFIINLGCNVNAYTNTGDPIIFKLLKDKRYEICTILMEADIDLYNRNLHTGLSFFEFIVTENLYLYLRHILDNYNFIIPHKLVSNISLIEIAARKNNTLIMHRLIEYFCSRKIQALARGYLIRNKCWPIFSN